ncbi:MAG: Hpt domain-containing protein [Bacteroidales bacterium]|nr:Hpt domain-containing protein [Bacteroidales bacterium]
MSQKSAMKVIDQQMFMNTFQYFDKHIVLEIIDLFIRDYPARMSDIKKAIDTKDFSTLKFDAHSMKGVIANFMAEETEDIARTLENKGADEEGTMLEETYIKLEKSGAKLVDDLKELRQYFLE